MLYPYCTFDDGTEAVYSGSFLEDGRTKAIVHFERPTDEGFDSIRCELPEYRWITWEGKFTDEERAFFDRFVHEHEGFFMRPEGLIIGGRMVRDGNESI